MKRTIFFVVIGLALTVIASSFAQQKPKDKQKPSQEEEIVRLGTTLVQIDAVVTDKNGKHVADLKPEDFEVLQDGKPQKITNFSYIFDQPLKSVTPPVKAPKEKNTDKNAISVPVAPAIIKKSDIKRTIAIVVD